ncbi:Uncharacterised protein [Streptococcus pneumoniae]|nr:Uncharacterised protein [Streptococcus pneumoniae]
MGDDLRREQLLCCELHALLARSLRLLAVPSLPFGVGQALATKAHGQPCGLEQLVQLVHALRPLALVLQVLHGQGDALGEGLPTLLLGLNVHRRVSTALVPVGPVLPDRLHAVPHGLVTVLHPDSLHLLIQHHSSPLPGVIVTPHRPAGIQVDVRQQHVNVEQALVTVPLTVKQHGEATICPRLLSGALHQLEGISARLVVVGVYLFAGEAEHRSPSVQPRGGHLVVSVQTTHRRHEQRGISRRIQTRNVDRSLRSALLLEVENRGPHGLLHPCDLAEIHHEISPRLPCSCSAGSPRRESPRSCAALPGHPRRRPAARSPDVRRRCPRCAASWRPDPSRSPGG